MVQKKVPDRKLKYANKLKELFNKYDNVLVIGADNVGSKQMQQVRLALRNGDGPRGEVLMGKNTIMRKVIRDLTEDKSELEVILPYVIGNMGFIFTNSDLKQVRELVESFKVPAAARSGAIAPIDVVLPAGPTGLDPGQTSFFQAMNIATKINRGAIEIINPVQLIKKGERVSSSAVALLSKLNNKPFSFSIIVQQVYENGSLYAAEILDLSDDAIVGKIMRGASLIAAVSMQLRIPTLAAVPHYFIKTFSKLLAVSLATDYTFEQAQIFKDFLANPDAFKVAAAPAAGGAPAAAAVAAPEPEEEEEEAAAVDMFGGDDDY